MTLYTFKEHQYEAVSVGASVERRATGSETTLLEPKGQILLSNGFVPQWAVGELIVGRRDNKYLLLGHGVHELGETKVPAEKIDCLAYAGRFSVPGGVVEGRRIILSYCGRDIVDVLMTQRVDISEILERVKNGEGGLQ